MTQAPPADGAGAAAAPTDALTSAPADALTPASVEATTPAESPAAVAESADSAESAAPAGAEATTVLGTPAADVIDAVLGDTASAVRAVRETRPAVVAHTQGVYAALLDGPATAAIGRDRVVAAAVAVAELAGAPRLAAHYAALGSVPAEGDPVLAAVLRHAARVTTAPASITRADIDALAAVGLSERDIVTVAQLIGFVHFQVRLLAGLELIGAEHE
ncbi:hypothetical protein D7D52_05805 [Nocardia yunnanensis]|uniref:CMD domain protein n=1 Tax=Nocardia yunnanensis TaxID=2382165 RepID=A0A386Z6Q0_9NOCA|nr:hypothetical protein [Nocardia yunnanensis]AYF73452.1 hypothetical protein D7D52_05805 [Nocardia yunnanensis]